MESLFHKKPESKKPSTDNQEKSESKDHIFESNQSFQIVKKKIIKRKD